MIKIKDRIFLGIVTGVIGSLPGRLLNAYEYRVGLTEAKYGQMAANLFVHKEQVNTTEGKTIGAITNGILTGLTGITSVYILSLTGRDKALLKGVGIGSLFWLGLFGLTSKAGLIHKPQKPLTHLLGFVDHLIFGSLCGLTAARLGDDSLFPDTRSQNGEEKTP